MTDFLEVQKNSSTELELINNWLRACEAEKKPALVIYYEGDYAYIAANVTHLASGNKQDLLFDHDSVNAQFLSLAISNPTGSFNYWNHNNLYFTFDRINKTEAPAIATRIANILNAGFISNPTPK